MKSVFLLWFLLENTAHIMVITSVILVFCYSTGFITVCFEASYYGH